MYVNTDKKLIYLANPRTASRATQFAIRKQAGFEKVGLPPHAGFEDTDWGRAYKPDGFNRTDWTVFCTVRNHWDALVSWWMNRDSKASEFGVEAIEETVQGSGYIRPDEGRLWAHVPSSDRILYFETIGDDLNELLQEFGLSVDLPHKNPTETRDDRPYQDYYTPETRDYVWDTFHDEIISLGYRF